MPIPWTQTPKEILLTLPVPVSTRAKDVVWRLTTSAIEIRLSSSTPQEPLLHGSFYHAIRPDDSTWELESCADGSKELRIGLCKARPNMSWDCCFMDEVDETITHRCFMDVAIGSRGTGRIVYGLYGNSYPRTVENFRCLCTGERGAVRVRKKAPPIRLHYKDTTFFRVVPGFLCQAGDVTRHPQNVGGRAIYPGGRFDDEGFRVKHKGAGDILMANAGIPNNNHSQFAVAMARLTEFESRRVSQPRRPPGGACTQARAHESDASPRYCSHPGTSSLGVLLTAWTCCESWSSRAQQRATLDTLSL